MLLAAYVILASLAGIALAGLALVFAQRIAGPEDLPAARLERKIDSADLIQVLKQGKVKS